MALSTGSLIKALQWRYATKIFDKDKKIPTDIWNCIEDSLVLSPSSYGLQPWHFLVIRNMEIRSQLRPHSWNQSQITDCSHLVVLLNKRTISTADGDNLIAAMAAKRNVNIDTLEAYKQMIMKDLIDGPRNAQIQKWASNQVYIALGNLMTSAALLDVDTCAIEGFNPVEYDSILNLNHSDFQSCVVCACGYRSNQDKYASAAKVRYDKSILITQL
jgi:nitroreductase